MSTPGRAARGVAGKSKNESTGIFKSRRGIQPWVRPLSRFIRHGIDFAVDGAIENIYRIVASFATISQIVDLILSVIAAATTALLLALITRDNIGMPPDMCASPR